MILSPFTNAVHAVLFDLDGTLLDRAGSLEFFLDRQYQRFSGELSSIDQHAYVRAIVAWDQYGYVPKVEVYALAQTTFALSRKLGGALLDDFEANFHSLAIPFPGMREMLESLASMSLALGLVTNGAVRSQWPKIEALGIAGHFKAILISEAQGVRKPNPEIYQRAMRELGSDAGSTVFIGDHPEADIEGASRLGMKTIWKRNTCWSAPRQMDASIDGLAEIPAIISRWREAM